MRDMAVVFELTQGYRSGTKILAFLFLHFETIATQWRERFRLL